MNHSMPVGEGWQVKENESEKREKRMKIRYEQETTKKKVGRENGCQVLYVCAEGRVGVSPTKKNPPNMKSNQDYRIKSGKYTRR